MADLETGLYRLAHDWGAAGGPSISTAINLMTDTSSPSGDQRPARSVEVLDVTAGATLEIVWADGTTKSYEVPAGKIDTSAARFDACSIAHITANTDVSWLRVKW
jgi:hypothetical protein